MNAAEMHRELCAVYGQNVLSEGSVRQWRGMFKDELTGGEVVGRSYVVNDELVQTVL
jgi:hypothetical protein